jgi:hypothetical protein
MTWSLTFLFSSLPLSISFWFFSFISLFSSLCVTLHIDWFFFLLLSLSNKTQSLFIGRKDFPSSMNTRHQMQENNNQPLIGPGQKLGPLLLVQGRACRCFPCKSQPNNRWKYNNNNKNNRAKANKGE